MTKLFETAAEEAKRLKKTPNAGEIADLYGLYKQATVGVVTFARPGFLDFTGRAKWDAWNSKKELTKEQAMAAYVGLVEQLKEKYGLEEELKVKYGLEEELKEKYGVEEELKEKLGFEEEKQN